MKLLAQQYKTLYNLNVMSPFPLFLIAILGGSPGSIVGMFFFRHKTRHASFRYGLPLIFVLELIAVLFLYRLRFTA